MKPLFKITSGFSLDLVMILIVAGILVSCSQKSVVVGSTRNQQLPIVVRSTEVTSIEQHKGFETTYGIIVAVKALCKDDVNTILYLKTNFDASLWHLNEKEFYPFGGAYFETSILFLENGEMFSMYASGKRDEPIFDLQNNMVSTMQTFVFPKIPSEESTFTIKAKVSLHDLPVTYIPPIKVDFLEPGIIEIPMEYIVSAEIGECP
ncbi:MAG TPA: hypothetical protein PLI15_14865 [Anaerolineales bacterium]|nr:hypothetical protein [Anaerolineales bacterium]HMZ44331.1 hypothetical protein [Anaerolineales bacterium]HNC88990.1 hypothetical protein [Anaerolineales bacterium]HNE06142.1 hypothetical protein [Anaerolineales bacterium]